jgi:hypothetical protein
MASVDNSERFQASDEFKPLLEKAIETFGRNVVVTEMLRAPGTRPYASRKHAMSSLKSYLTGVTHLSWGALRAYDWAMQQFWPMAMPQQCQVVIRGHRMFPSKKRQAVPEFVPMHTDRQAEAVAAEEIGGIMADVEEFLAGDEKPVTLGEQILRAYLARDDDEILRLTEGLQ